MNISDYVLDVSSLMSGTVSSMEISKELEINSEEISPNITLTSKVSINGKLENLSGYVHLNADISCSYSSLCARCLKEVDKSIETGIDKAVCKSGTLENEDAENVITDYLIIENNEIDLAALCAEELMFALPYRELCSEDCKGLCPKCGKDLNEGECNCSFKEIDPRLAVLAQLLDNDKQD